MNAPRKNGRPRVDGDKTTMIYAVRVGLDVAEILKHHSAPAEIREVLYRHARQKYDAFRARESADGL